jgi:hypothetical protein
MKKLILVLLLICALLLTACGSSDSFTEPASVPTPAPAGASPPRLQAEHFLAEEAEFGLWDDDGAVRRVESVYGAAIVSTISAEHIIYHASASIHTAEFDDTIERVHKLTDQHRGFIGSSHMGGSYWQQRHGDSFWGRNADFSIRVPADAYRAMTEALNTLGTVVSLSTSATNVSAEHADIASRLASLRVQEERILALMEDAIQLSDLLELEARLGELIWQIERLTADQTHLNNQIAYSTVHLWITEVEDEEISLREHGSNLGNTFTRSIQTMGTFGLTLLTVFTAILPWTLLAGAIAMPVLLIVRRVKGKKL